MSKRSTATHKISAKRAACLLALLIGAALWSCSSNSTDENLAEEVNVSLGPQPEVLYNLPKGWTRSGSLENAYWEKELGPGIPFTKLEYIKSELGGETEAKERGLAVYQIWTGENCESFSCAQEENQYELKTLKIGKHTLFLHTSPGYYYGDIFWQSNFGFIKDGVVYHLSLYGEPIEKYEEELAVILNSIRLNQ